MNKELLQTERGNLPETLVTSAYKETPETSRERIYKRVMEQYPNAAEKQIKTLMK